MAQDEELVTFSVEPLAKHHNRANFSCGIEAFDSYLNRQANQDVNRGVSATFVVVTSNNDVVSYYTLSAFSIDLPALPAQLVKKLPKYPTIPATLLGRLAVDRNHHGRGLGEFLLMDALSRSNRATSDIASYAVVVDAKKRSGRRLLSEVRFHTVFRQSESSLPPDEHHPKIIWLAQSVLYNSLE